MPFDLASAKPAEASGGFDLASAKPVGVAARPAGPPPPTPAPRGAMATFGDMLSAPKDIVLPMVTGTLAEPTANIAGMAATAYEAATKGGKGDGEMPGKFRDAVREHLTYQPNNPTLEKGMEIPRQVGKAVGDTVGAFKDFAKGGSADNQPRGMAVNAGFEGVKQAAGMAGMKVAPKVPGSLDTLTGATAKAARGDAMTAARGALGDVEAAHGRTQAARMTEAQGYDDVVARTQRELDAARQRTGTPTADVIGGQVRDGYLNVMQEAKAARAAAVDPLYEAAQTAAAAREATGARVNVQPAIADIDEMLKLSENLPDLQAKLLKLRGAVEAPPAKQGVAAPIGSGKVTSKLQSPRAAPPTSPGLTYQELDMASRYVKDIAFSGEAEGYGALIRNTAKKLSVALDKQISEFVPEHAAATAKYRELSAPMETMATRIGEALHETEGGLKGDAYSKVPAQDLPSRIFSRKERIEQLVDAMAGGKNATPEARTAAQAKVDTWVENWILDSKRGKVGDAARVDAPGQRAALNAAPGAAGRVGMTLEAEQAKLARVPELQEAAKRTRAEAQAAEGSRLKVRQSIERADLDLAHGSADQAYKGYVEALRQNMAVADPERYKAAIALIDRAATLEEKTKRARKLALGVAGLAGVAGAAKVGVQLPGVMGQ